MGSIWSDLELLAAEEHGQELRAQAERDRLVREALRGAESSLALRLMRVIDLIGDSLIPRSGRREGDQRRN